MAVTASSPASSALAESPRWPRWVAKPGMRAAAVARVCSQACSVAKMSSSCHLYFSGMAERSPARAGKAIPALRAKVRNVRMGFRMVGSFREGTDLWSVN